VARCVQHIELERTGAERLALAQGHDVLEARSQRTELSTQWLSGFDHLTFHVVHGDRHRTERLAQLVQPGDVVEVGMREHDGLYIDASVPGQVDDEVGFEVGIDHHRVARVLIFDEIGVRAESPVSGDLDVEPQSALRTTT